LFLSAAAAMGRLSQRFRGHLVSDQQGRARLQAGHDLCAGAPGWTGAPAKQKQCRPGRPRHGERQTRAVENQWRAPHAHIIGQVLHNDDTMSPVGGGPIGAESINQTANQMDTIGARLRGRRAAANTADGIEMQMRLGRGRTTTSAARHRLLVVLLRSNDKLEPADEPLAIRV
jgi:hypothetical protein